MRGPTCTFWASLTPFSLSLKDLAAYIKFAGETAAAANVSLIIDTNFGTSSPRP